MKCRICLQAAQGLSNGRCKECEPYMPYANTQNERAQLQATKFMDLQDENIKLRLLLIRFNPWISLNGIDRMIKDEFV
jgi:hypothetical protein